MFASIRSTKTDRAAKLRQASSRRGRLPQRLQLEPLEDRTLPSAVVMATPIDFSPSRVGGVASNTATARVYAAAEDVPAVKVIDSATNALVLPSIQTRGYHTDIAVNPLTNRIYAAQQFA